MKAHFQGEIEGLNRSLRALADQVLEMVRRATTAAARGDVSFAAAVADADKDVDREEVRIEEECLKLLALYAPIADELRYVYGVTKVLHELERIGDLARKVARQAGATTSVALPAVARDRTLLGELAATAVAQAIDAFILRNAEAARTLWEHDAALDEIHDRLIARYEEALDRQEAPVRDLLAARSVVSALERIGDHATRIAKLVIYLRHGEVVRHRSPSADRQRVLFICVHNSARSQMAEAWLKHLHGDRFEAESAGLEPGAVNPLAIAVMREVGIDISANGTQAVFDVVKSGRLYSYAITVCDEAAAERCPIFAGITRREHWSFPDPAALTGTQDERLAETRKIRDAIRTRIEAWVRGLGSGQEHAW